MDDLVDPRFGRCQYFIISDVDIELSEILENPNVHAAGGAGINAARFVAEKGAKAVLTGNVGPNAFRTLNAAGIDVITGVSGTVQDVIEKYKKGEYKPTESPSVQSHFGMPK